MPRHARAAPAGYVDHVLNRAVARLPLLQKDEDYRAFERVSVQAMAKHPTRILAYCLLPNHWHFVLWPNPFLIFTLYRALRMESLTQKSG